MFLGPAIFQQVVEVTPLVAIDLVVRDAHGRVLLGLRRNRPARNFWFVPGGRILKNERMDNAFLRLTLEELGKPMLRSTARPLGVFEHIYLDSIFGENIGTHYVVLGYLIDLPAGASLVPPAAQHQEYRWVSPGQVEADLSIHQYTGDYFAVLPSRSSAQEC
ncbi:MAG: NUDIX domain-containing protein [Gammaproteobacteria bacterium]|nr:NUDIX domain-containing protein [Gammaproteobacteria bacterium]